MPLDKNDGLGRAGTQRVLLQILVLNLAVSLAKLAAGVMSHSLAVLCDGLHSSIDAITIHYEPASAQPSAASLPKAGAQ